MKKLFAYSIPHKMEKMKGFHQLEVLTTKFFKKNVKPSIENYTRLRVCGISIEHFWYNFKQIQWRVY